jgi:hypothetical protein
MRMTRTRLPGVRSPLRLASHVQTTSFPYHVIQVALALTFDEARLNLPIVTVPQLSCHREGTAVHAPSYL